MQNLSCFTALDAPHHENNTCVMRLRFQLACGCRHRGVPSFPAASVPQGYGCMGRQVKAKASLSPPCTSAHHPTRRTLMKHATKYKDIDTRLRFDSSSHFSVWLWGQSIPANVPRRPLCSGDQIFCSPCQHVL